MYSRRPGTGRHDRTSFAPPSMNNIPRRCQLEEQSVRHRHCGEAPPTHVHRARRLAAIPGLGCLGCSRRSRPSVSTYFWPVFSFLFESEMIGSSGGVTSSSQYESYSPLSCRPASSASLVHQQAIEGHASDSYQKHASELWEDFWSPHQVLDALSAP